MTRAHRSRLTINELAVTQSHRDAMLMSYTVGAPAGRIFEPCDGNMRACSNVRGNVRACVRYCVQSTVARPPAAAPCARMDVPNFGAAASCNVLNVPHQCCLW